MFSRFFINRPIFAAVISIIIVLAGLVTLRALPIAMYPEISPPTVSVSATYPGASAQVLADTVATAIEEQVNGVDGMLYMSSTCSNNGSYELTVTFEIGTDPDMAAVLVQNRVAVAEPMLPEEVRRQGVTTRKRSTNIVLIATLTSPDDRYDELFLSNYATLRVKDELSRLDGVGNVMVFGLGDYSMRIWLDPDKLRSRNLTTGDVVNALREQNVQVAAGQLGQSPAPKGQDFQYTINTFGRLESAEQFEDVIVKTASGGRLTRIKDVARVELGAQSYDLSAQLDGKPNVALAVFQTPDANSLQVAERVEAKMGQLSKNFPQGIEYQIPVDTTQFITYSINEIMITLFIAVFLVFITLMVFLQDWRATLIPAATIPVSLIGTFAVMGLLGFSINTLSLFGIVLAIGIVVDDAIVVTENTVRNMDTLGLDAKQATIRAMGEVTGPVIATTLVLLAVFVPTAFLGGITGQLYRQFALTIAASTAFSTLNALTLSPALCAILLRPTSERRNWFARAFNRAFGKTTTLYQLTVGAMVRRAGVMLLVFGVLTGGAYIGFINLPTGFVPTEDQGWALVSVQLPDAASRERTLEVVDKINKRLDAMTGVEHWVSIPGYSILDGAVASNTATVFVSFDPWDKRTTPGLSQKALVGRMWQEFSGIREANIFAFIPPAIHGLGVSGGFEMQLQDRADVGLPALQQMARDITQEANAQAGLENVYSTFRANVPQRFADVDRTKVKTLDIPLSSVFDTLQTYLGSAYVNDFNKFGRTYQVRVQAEPSFRSRTHHIKRLEVRNNQGEMIPLGTLLSTRETLGPQFIKRYNMYPASSINGKAAPGYSSGQALTLMEQMAAAKLPASMGFEWTGMSYQEKTAGKQALFIFALAALFAYLVLCAQYESWSIPLAVVLAVPLAVFGMVVAVAVGGMDVNVYTQIGIVLLIGLASKTAILIVEFAKKERESGKRIIDAAMEAARIRFRPVLMTAFTFILGVFPLVTASGAGDASRRAVGTAVFGGMIAATVLGVFFVPVFYVAIQRFSEWIRPPKEISAGLKTLPQPIQKNK